MSYFLSYSYLLASITSAMTEALFHHLPAILNVEAETIQ